MKCLVAMLLFSTWVVFLGYSVIAPFFPPQLDARGLSSLYNSVVFAVYAITYVAISIVNGKIIIPRCGRSVAFFIGAVCQLIALGLLISLEYIPNNIVFIALAVVARLLQGAGSTVMVSLSYGIVSLAYPDNLNVLHTLLQMAITLGLAISPFAGRFFYQFLGYLGPFLFVGVLSIPPLFVPCVLAPLKFKNDNNEEQKAVYGKVLKNRRSVEVLVYLALKLTLYSAQESALSDWLHDLYGFDPETVSFYFFYHFISCVVTSVVMIFAPQNINVGAAICVALFFSSLASFLTGFSQFFSYTASQHVIIAGLVIVGVSTITPNYAVAQAINMSANSVRKDQFGSLINTVSSLRTIAAGIAFFVGPIFGGLISYYLGFDILMLIFGAMFLACAILEFSEVMHAKRMEKSGANKTQDTVDNDELDETDNEHRLLIDEKEIDNRLFMDDSIER